MAGLPVRADDDFRSQGGTQFSAPEFKKAGGDEFKIVEMRVDAEDFHRCAGETAAATQEIISADGRICELKRADAAVSSVREAIWLPNSTPHWSSTCVRAPTLSIAYC